MSEEARDDVGAAAGRKGHDQGYRSRRKGLRCGEAARQRQDQGEQRTSDVKCIVFSRECVQ